MSEPLERPLCKSLQRGEDAHFDQVSTHLLAACAFLNIYYILNVTVSYHLTFFPVLHGASLSIPKSRVNLDMHLGMFCTVCFKQLFENSFDELLNGKKMQHATLPNPLRESERGIWPMLLCETYGKEKKGENVKAKRKKEERKKENVK
jgi:hypothetical protein